MESESYLGGLFFISLILLRISSLETAFPFLSKLSQSKSALSVRKGLVLEFSGLAMYFDIYPFFISRNSQKIKLFSQA
ncbi:MAG: hypothetical protein ACLFQ0_21245, partial [Cyclobacteriaceae bacterium]